jgi:2'-hydroxyisoflavone reductase
VGAEPVWVSAAALEQASVTPWGELPLWVPEAPDTVGFSQIDCAKAIAAGLRFRPLATTVADTLAWASARPADYVWRAGLAAEKEGALLAQL